MKKYSYYLKKDLYRYGIEKVNFLVVLKYLFLNRVLRFIIIWRIANVAYRNNDKVIFIIFAMILKMRCINNLSEIPVRLKCEEGLFIQHFSGITINHEVKIGKNVHLHKGVTIGKEVRGKREGVPNIDDNVWIGVNSTIVGKIKVGKNVLIAPNTFVNIDIPDNSIVFGNPAKIKYNIQATKGYIGRKV